MKKKIFDAMMNATSAHSAALQRLGLTKWQVRDHSPIHRLLVYITFKLAPT